MEGIESIYFLTYDDEKCMCNCFCCSCLLCFSKSKNYMDWKINSLMEEQKLKIVKHSEYDDFNKENNQIYYDTFIIESPKRGVLYIRINEYSNNYYVDIKKYSKKKWQFYYRLYKYIFVPLGLKEISLQSYNGKNMNTVTKASIQAIENQLGLEFNKTSEENSYNNQIGNYKEPENIDAHMHMFKKKKDKITYLKNLIKDKDHQNIFYSSIENGNILQLINDRSGIQGGGQTEEIHEHIHFQTKENQSLGIKLQENISTYKAGLSFEHSKEIEAIENIKLNIYFWSFKNLNDRKNLFQIGGFNMISDRDINFPKLICYSCLVSPIVGRVWIDINKNDNCLCKSCYDLINLNKSENKIINSHKKQIFEEMTHDTYFLINLIGRWNTNIKGTFIDILSKPKIRNEFRVLYTINNDTIDHGTLVVNSKDDLTLINISNTSPEQKINVLYFDDSKAQYIYTDSLWSKKK